VTHSVCKWMKNYLSLSLSHTHTQTERHINPSLWKSHTRTLISDKHKDKYSKTASFTYNLSLSHTRTHTHTFKHTHFAHSLFTWYKCTQNANYVLSWFVAGRFQALVASKGLSPRFNIKYYILNFAIINIIYVAGNSGNPVIG